MELSEVECALAVVIEEPMERLAELDELDELAAPPSADVFEMPEPSTSPDELEMPERSPSLDPSTSAPVESSSPNEGEAAGARRQCTRRGYEQR